MGAVGCVVDAVQRTEAAQAGVGTGLPWRSGIDDSVRGHRVRAGVEHRAEHLLPPEATLAHGEAQQDSRRHAERAEPVGLGVGHPTCRGETTSAVADLVDRQVGPLLHGPTDVAEGDTRSRADARRVRRLAAIGPIHSVARRIDVDHIGVGHLDRLVVEAELGHRAGPIALHHDVDPAGDFADESDALRGGEVDGDAVLALHDLRSPGLGKGQDAADAVTLERLDLDDPGAEVGEHGGAMGRGEQGCQFETRDPLQWHVARPSGGCGFDGHRLGGEREDLGTVFVEPGGAAREIGRGDGRLDDCPRLAHGAALTVDDIDHHGVVDQLGVLQCSRTAAELLGEHVRVGVEDLVPLGERLLPRRFEHASPQLHPLVGIWEQGQALPLLVGEHPVETQCLHLRREQMGCHGGKLEPGTVLGEGHEKHERERASWPTLGIVSVGLVESVGPAVGDEVLEPGPGVDGGERLEKVGLDQLPEATALTLDERSKDAVDGHLAGGEAGEGNADEGRGLVRAHATEGVEDTKLGHDNALVAGGVGVGALAAETGDRGVDETRVCRSERAVAEAESIEHPGLMGLDQHVGVAG